MDRSSIFKQLGVGVKFDLKRFGADAKRLVRDSTTTSLFNTSKTNTRISTQNGDVDLHSVSSSSISSASNKSKKKRKRKASSNTTTVTAVNQNDNVNDDDANVNDANDRDDDEEENPSSRKRKRTSSSCMTKLNGDVDDAGGIQLMTGVGASSTKSISVDATEGVPKKKKKKKKTHNDVATGRSRQEEQVNALRNSLKINVKGTDIPHPIETFDDLNLHPTLVENLKKFEFQRPTPIQMQAAPVLMQGRNVLACAPTGSGKTLAFSLPVLHRLGGPKKDVGFRAVLLSPTRELALQTYRVFHRLAEGTKMKVFMVDSRREKAAEKFAPKKSKGARYDVLITTPNRLVGLLERKPKPGVSLKNVECLVVDESDKLFETNSKDGGFRQQLATIYKACVNPKIQLAMFSATYQSNVEEWCRQHLDNVVEVTIGAKNSTVTTIDQRVQFVGSKEGKIIALREIVKKGVTPPVLVFTESQESAEKLHSELIYDTVNVDVIHAGKTQLQREEAIKKFRVGSTWILICTELLGRGMDFQGVNLVVNYDFPRSAISYVHRIGRTGRAGRKGEAITFFTEDDTEFLRSIAGVMRNSGCVIPDHLLILTEKRKEISRMNKQRISRIRENRKNKRKPVVPPT